MSKTRDFCFTHNNYTTEDEKRYADCPCAYIVYGREVGESGTPHLQGYVRFPSQRTLKSVIARFPGAHIEIKKGTCEQAIDYCKKDKDVYERGEAPKTQEAKGAMNKKRCADAWLAATEGRIDDIPEDLRIRYYGTFKRIREDYKPQPQPLTVLQNEWRYGPTGTGKTRGAHEEFPGAYIKKANTKWWNRYDGEEVVIIDDIDKYHVQLGYELKIWLDHPPFPAENKGGENMIRPKRIIITSNYHPSEIWPDKSTLDPLLRRLKVIYMGPPPIEGPADFEGHFNKKQFK